MFQDEHPVFDRCDSVSVLTQHIRRVSLSPLELFLQSLAGSLCNIRTISTLSAITVSFMCEVPGHFSFDGLAFIPVSCGTLFPPSPLPPSCWEPTRSQLITIKGSDLLHRWLLYLNTPLQPASAFLYVAH